MNHPQQPYLDALTAIVEPPTPHMVDNGITYPINDDFPTLSSSVSQLDVQLANEYLSASLLLPRQRTHGPNTPHPTPKPLTWTTALLLDLALLTLTFLAALTLATLTR